jgi:homoserine dehydrogenase
MRVGIGILGGGTVGGSLANQLLRDAAAIKAKSGIDAALVLVGVRDLAKARNFPSEYATDRLEDLVDDDRVNLVVELLGGIEPARTLLLKALDAGKPVVTANKELMARHGEELIGRAAERGVSLLFEAAVGGAIPIIRPLSESLAGERIDRVMGIVNGTTNFILTAMEDEGREYEDVLAEAQSLGFAEADPTADVGGHDSASKAAILAGLAFGVWVDASQVCRCRDGELVGLHRQTPGDSRWRGQRPCGSGSSMPSSRDTSACLGSRRLERNLCRRPQPRPVAVLRARCRWSADGYSSAG